MVRNYFFPVLFVFLVSASLDAAISLSDESKGMMVENIGGCARFSGMPLYGEPGCPLLPSKSYTVLLPPDADLSTVSFCIEGLKENEIKGSYAVNPASPPLSIEGPVWPLDRNIVNGKDNDIYSGNRFYPGNYIVCVTTGMMRCYKIATVRVSFARYNPVSGSMKVLEHGNLVWHAARSSAERNTSSAIPRKFDKLVSRLTLNYSDIAPLYYSKHSLSEISTYVIMTDAAIKTNSKQLDALIKSKKDQGFDVKLLTEPDWGGGTGNQAAENMRKWLQDNYQTMNIEFVLLIGDPNSTSGKVPMKKAQRNTDFYYSELSGPWESDVLAEISASRIPVYNNDYTTLDKILEKIIKYENAPAQEIDWRKFCFIAEKPYDAQTPGYPLFEAIKKDFLDPEKWGNYRIYDVSTGNPDESSCNETAVKNAWAKLKFGLMLWMTHGSATGASSIMKSTTMAEFSDAYPPIVFMGSCSNASISNSGNLTYTALKNAGIGAIGGTDITWYGDAQINNFAATSTTQGLLYQFAQGIADSLGAGDALNFAIGKCTDKKWWINIEGYVLYGCPEIGVFTCAKATAVNGGLISDNLNSASAHKLTMTAAGDKITFSVSALSDGYYAALSIYDLTGKEILRHSDMNCSAGEISSGDQFCVWDLNRRPASNGTYITVLTLKDQTSGRLTKVQSRLTVAR